MKLKEKNNLFSKFMIEKNIVNAFLLNKKVKSLKDEQNNQKDIFNSLTIENLHIKQKKTVINTKLILQNSIKIQPLVLINSHQKIILTPKKLLIIQEKTINDKIQKLKHSNNYMKNLNKPTHSQNYDYLFTTYTISSNRNKINNLFLN